MQTNCKIGGEKKSLCPIAQADINMHSFRLVGGAETDSWDREDTQQGGRRTVWSHIHVQISWEEQLGSKTDHATQGSSVEK